MSATVQPEVAVSPGSLSHRQVRLVFVGLMSGMFLAALDQSIVGTALPTIVGELGGLQHYSWVATSYMLTSTASAPLYGKLSDLYGRRGVFQAAIVIFLVGSVLGGVAQDMTQLIVFRAVQGLGAGGIMVLAMAIVGDIVSPRERGRYQGYVGTVFAASSIVGPLFGGFFVDHLTWRWIFYINLPVGAVALVITTSALRLPFKRQEHAIDYLGSALLVAAVSTFLLVTVWGGREHAWGSATILGLLAGSTALLVLFILRERSAAEPVLPLRLFRSPIFSISVAGLFIVGLSMFGAVIFLPLFLQLVTGASATKSGLLMLPMMGGLMTASVVSGQIITRVGRYKIFPVAGAGIVSVGIALLSTLEADTSRVTSGVFMAITGAGIGLIMPVLMLVLQNAVDHRDLGTATSAGNFFRSMGGAVGVAVYGAILTNRMDHNFARLFPGAGAGGVGLDKLQGSPEKVRALPAPIRDGVIEAFERSIHVVFLWAIPAAVAGFVLLLFLKEIPLRTSAGARPGEPDSDATAAAALESLA